MCAFLEYDFSIREQPGQSSYRYYFNIIYLEVEASPLLFTTLQLSLPTDASASPSPSYPPCTSYDPSNPQHNPSPSSFDPPNTFIVRAILASTSLNSSVHTQLHKEAIRKRRAFLIFVWRAIRSRMLYGYLVSMCRWAGRRVRRYESASCWTGVRCG